MNPTDSIDDFDIDEHITAASALMSGTARTALADRWFAGRLGTA
jgi:hypothetical protein